MFDPQPSVDTATVAPTQSYPSPRPSLSGVSSSKTESSECLFYSPTHSLSLSVTIEELSDKVLLKIFRYFLDASPRHWIRLAHICHKWRRIVFEARQTLSLRLFCTHGTPVLKNLDCWPPLPIVVEYAGSPVLRRPTQKDEDNIVAALKRSERVHSINLTVTSSLPKKLSTLKGQFSELEDLILSRDCAMPLILPVTFRWGPRLRRLHSTSIAFPTFLQLLSSSNNLVDLRLHDVPNISHISPEALTKPLSGMSQLRSFSLHFPSAATYRAPSHPSKERFVLPSLTRLDFQGITWYLEGLVDIIDAPQLEDIEITLFHNSVFWHPKLCEFIDRMERHKSHSRAHILFSEDAISISLMQPGAPMCITLQLFCKPPRVQMFSMARICANFSAFILNVRDLRISSTRLEMREGGYIERWPELLKPSLNLVLKSFSGVTWLHLDAKCLKNVMHVLSFLERQPQNVLPVLRKLYIPQAERLVPLTESVASFVTSRDLSGHRIEVYKSFSEIFRTGTCLGSCAAVPSSTPTTR